MALTKTTDLVLEGIGESFLLGTDGSVSPLGKLQDMKISITTSTEKVFGGDSIFQFYEFIKDKTCSFTFTNATFNLNMIELSQGSTASAGELYGNETLTVAAKTLTLSKTANVSTVIGDTSVVDVDTAKPLTPVAATPTDGQFTITAAGVITLGGTVADGKQFLVNYVYTDTVNTVGTDILTTSVPGFCELRHKSKQILMPDGHTYQVHTRVYRARCDGKLDVDFKRGAASAPSLTFSSLNPDRADKKFLSFTIEKVS